MKIKLVTIQITYFCGVIQSEITTAKRERNGSAEKLQVTSEEQYFLFHNWKTFIWSQGKPTKTIAPSTVSQS